MGINRQIRIYVLTFILLRTWWNYRKLFFLLHKSIMRVIICLFSLEIFFLTRLFTSWLFVFNFDLLTFPVVFHNKLGCRLAHLKSFGCLVDCQMVFLYQFNQLLFLLSKKLFTLELIKLCSFLGYFALS